MSNPYDQRRPTKAERKEQARLEREAIQRQMATRKRNRTIGLSLVAVGAVAVIVAVVVLQPETSDRSGQPAPTDLLTRASAAAQTAGCSEVQTIGEYAGADAAHIEGDERFPQLPALDTYPSTPPTSGPHVGAVALPAGVSDTAPDIGPAIHTLEHGGTMVWYSPDAPQADVEAITAFYDGSDPVGQDRVIVGPYDYEGAGGQLPEGVQMALVAWHRLQTCATPSLEVAFDFTSQYSAPTTQDREYAGEAPEAGAVM